MFNDYLKDQMDRPIFTLKNLIGFLLALIGPALIIVGLVDGVPVAISLIGLACLIVGSIIVDLKVAIGICGIFLGIIMILRKL